MLVDFNNKPLLLEYLVSVAVFWPYDSPLTDMRKSRKGVILVFISISGNQINDNER